MNQPRVTAKHLLERLHRHYIKPSAPLPGGVFVPEVGLNNGGQQRRCDAIYAGFTSASGRLLIGHEIKVSRADWRHELDEPEKSQVWSDQCHAWYIVAPSTDVVPVEELPHGWGLMVPNPRTTTRMTIAVKATVHEDRVPSWLVVRSIMGRLDSLRAQHDTQVRHAERERAAAELQQRLEQRAALANPEAARDSQILDELEKLLGVDLRRADYRRHELFVRPDELATALAVVRLREKLTKRWRGLEDQADQLAATAAQLRDLDSLLTMSLPTAVCPSCGCDLTDPDVPHLLDCEDAA